MLIPQELQLSPKLCKSDLLKLHGIAENFYRFLFYGELDTAECDAHFRLK